MIAVFAQKPDTAVGKATYEFVHLRDTNHRDKPYKETMVLLLGRHASHYRSLDKQLQQDQLTRQILDQVKHAPNPNSIDLNITGGGVVTSDEYYQFADGKKLLTEQYIINYYLVDEPLPQIYWKLQKDTISFGSLHCQKATANFKGRDYEAWFCAQLPFRNGPWKLQGLPGLIVEAHDTKMEVIFKFAGFEDIRNLHQPIEPPVDDILTTPEKLARLMEARAKDPIGFRNAAHESASSHRSGPLDLIKPAQIHSINVVKNGNGNTNIINNPIELPEKE